jgi:hypothetical protein
MAYVISALISTDDKFSASAKAKASRVQSLLVNDCSTNDICVSLSSEMHLRRM